MMAVRPPRVTRRGATRAVAAANQARMAPRPFTPATVVKSGRSREVEVVSKVSVAPTSAAVTAGEFNFQEYMMGRADDVNTALDQCLPMAYPESVHESMRYSLLAGGKRIRPMLCVAAFELFATRMDTVMPTACALEMIHTMTLMHDDLPCMDNDDFRRGVPTNHKVYGEEVAILAGDALLTYAFEYIAEKTPTEGDGCADPRTVLKVLSYIGRKVGSTGLVGGQIVDIEMEGRSEEASLETLQYIHAKKTADLLDAAVVCGAMLGGAREEDVARLTKYSQNIGLAFQVVDDILDCTMSSEELGKTAGKDEAVGKTTYPSLLGLDESRRIAQKLIDDAKAELSSYDQAKAAPLLALADYIGNRQN